MTPLPTLAQRVEAAEGPDRELDAELLRVSDPSLEVRGLSVWRGYLCCGSLADCLPRYTASLDAALALVTSKLPGSGTHWEVGTDYRRYYALVSVSYYPTLSTSRQSTAKASTPALALLLALLRALESEHG